MKLEWEFQFSTRGFKFAREYKYRMEIADKISIGGREPEQITPVIRIIPNDHEPFPDTDQIGSMHVLLPYPPEETRDFSLYCATTVAERISFTHGDFRISSGLIACKRIPETAEEEIEIGESIYLVEVKLIEDIPPAEYNSNMAQMAPSHACMLPLLAQFNESKRIKHPIAQFISFFKIIESLTHVKNERRTLKVVLAQSSDLRRIYNTLGSSIDFDSFVDRAATARHNCAHLKISNNFGYTPFDSAIKTEVEPLLSVLESLARASIAQWPEAGA